MSQLKKNQSLRSLMDTFFLLVHIAFGSVALLAAALAFLTKKGPKFHAKVGRVYALAMIGVGLTAGALWWLGSTDFLLFIAFFSTYMVLVGWRLGQNRKVQSATSIKRLLGWESSAHWVFCSFL